jgi:hypothetical protein
MAYTRPKGYYNDRHKAYRLVKKERLDALKASTGCQNCPERDPDCLDFHHRDPATKTMTISRLYAGTWGWARIQQEIDLCMVLCANCHRKAHAALRRT